MSCLRKIAIGVSISGLAVGSFLAGAYSKKKETKEKLAHLRCKVKHLKLPKRKK